MELLAYKRNYKFAAGRCVIVLKLIEETLILSFSTLVRIQGRHGSLLDLETNLFQFRRANPEFGIQQGGHGCIIKLFVCDLLGYVEIYVAKGGNEVPSDEGEGSRHEKTVPGPVYACFFLFGL